MQPRAKSWVPSLKEAGVTSPECWQQLKRCPSPFPGQVALGFAAPGREQPQPQRIPPPLQPAPTRDPVSALPGYPQPTAAAAASPAGASPAVSSWGCHRVCGHQAPEPGCCTTEGEQNTPRDGIFFLAETSILFSQVQINGFVPLIRKC